MKIDLRRLILLLALTSLLLTLTNALFASFRVQKASLIEGTLEVNHAYATKIAASVEELLSSAQRQLQYSATMLSTRLQDPNFVEAEARRVQQQTDTFNSVVIADETGLVLATDPNLGLLGQTLSSEGSILARQVRAPLISPPFVSQTGRLLITVSHPIFDNSHVYRGYISGTIYLQEASILSHMLGKHFHKDGSYVYVVDSSKRLISHPDAERVGDVVENNPAINNVVTGSSGATELTNSQHVRMLAGYAPVPGTGWGIVSQRPQAITLAPLNELITQVLLDALPMTIFIVLIIIWSARLISKPLRRLAESAAAIDRPETARDIENIRAWYFETAHLKKALHTGVMLMYGKLSKANTAAETDSLTGLSNRRAYDTAVKRWKNDKTSVAVIAVDIDHFKRVNDTYGHDVGDVVLKRLALLMKSCSRREDLVCRMGGEEFLILVPDAELDAVSEMAERLRKTVERHVFEHVGHITISLGVAMGSSPDSDIAELVKLADKMLYLAKNNGRNRVETSQHPS